MICDPCGKNLSYQPRAVCRECYKRLQQENRFLLQQLEAAQQAIIRLESEKN